MKESQHANASCRTQGEGRFESISWDTALAGSAERLREIVVTTGAHTIINTPYTGTISLLAHTFSPHMMPCHTVA
jgi:anaerobic selenocysteine-containing dehydrogenase